MADITVEESPEESFVIEKVEEGVKFEEKLLPIDINYGKLADWLVDRKKAPADWRKRLVAIQGRINKLLPDLPRGTNPVLLSLPSHSEGSSVSYIEAKEVRNALVSANPGDRTLFGGYSGVTGNWDSVVRAYEKELVYLGEASTILVQNANYDIPYFRKQASKLQQQIADVDRKEAEYRKAAAASSQAFQAACKELGIEGGGDIRAELRLLLRELPSTFQGVIDSACQADGVATAVEYYRQFISHVHSQEAGKLLPVLTALRSDPASALLPEEPGAGDKGTSTSAGDAAGTGGALEINWDLSASTDTGTPAINWDVPIGDETPAGSINWDISAAETSGGSVAESAVPSIQWDIGTSSGEVEGTPPAINWDLGAAELATVSGDTAQGAAGQIQWDIDTSGATDVGGTSGEGGAAIDWGIGTATAVDLTGGDGAAATGGGSTDGAPQIVWDFSIEEAGSGREDTSGAAEASQPPGATAASARGAMEAAEREVARHRLAQAEYRSRLLDDLFELCAFLRQRKVEMEREEGSPLQTQLLASAPPGPVQELSASGVAALEAAVRLIIGSLTSRRTTDLLLIHSSRRYLERLEESLVRKKGNEARLLGSIEELHRKRGELRQSLNATWLKQEEAVRRTRAIKQLTEKTLSAQYGGRPVNVIGEINNQLGPSS